MAFLGDSIKHLSYSEELKIPLWTPRESWLYANLLTSDYLSLDERPEPQIDQISRETPEHTYVRCALMGALQIGQITWREIDDLRKLSSFEAFVKATSGEKSDERIFGKAVEYLEEADDLIAFSLKEDPTLLKELSNVRTKVAFLQKAKQYTLSISVVNTILSIPFISTIIGLTLTYFEKSLDRKLEKTGTERKRLRAIKRTNTQNGRKLRKTKCM